MIKSIEIMNRKKFFAFWPIVALLLSVAVVATPVAATPTQKVLDNALFAAINNNDVERAKSLLKRGASVNARDTEGSTALINVSFIGGPEDETTGVDSTDLLKLFLNYKPNVNLADANGNTALMEAAGSSPEAVRLLIAKGSSINFQNHAGETALMRAVAYPCEGLCSNPECVKILLAHGAKVNVATKLGDTALIYAAQLSFYNQEDALLNAKMLLARGADVRARTDNGNTALKWAKAGGNPAFIRLIQNALSKKHTNKNARDN